MMKLSMMISCVGNSKVLAWQNDGDDWNGIDGKEFQELKNRYMERKKAAFNSIKFLFYLLFFHQIH